MLFAIYLPVDVMQSFTFAVSTVINLRFMDVMFGVHFNLTNYDDTISVSK